MISSIIFIVVQLAGKVDTSNLSVFWKIYVPACIIEVITYFYCLRKGEKNEYEVLS